MLTQISLERFKSLSTIESIDLRQLSILCGSNSSGKSSLIQAVLMLSQTFCSRYDFDSFVLNGHLVRLGSFGDIRSHNSKSEDIRIGFTLEDPQIQLPEGKILSIQYECVFGRPAGGTHKMDDDYHPAILSLRAKIRRITGEREVVESIAMSRQQTLAMGAEEGKQAVSWQYQVDSLDVIEIERIRKEFPDFEIKGCESTGFLPTTLIIEYDDAKKMAANVIGLIAGRNARKGSWRPSGDYVESGLLIPKSFFYLLRSCIDEERTALRASLNPSAELTRALKEIANASQLNVEEVWNRMVDENLALNPEIVDDRLIERDVTTLADWFLFLNELDEKKRKSLTELIDKRRAELETAWYEGMPKERKMARITLHSFSFIATSLTLYFGRSVKYLGPLRNEPQAVYASLGHTDPKSVGLKGEYAAAVLHINRNKTIDFPSPTLADDHSFRCTEKRGSLQQACKEWLSYLGVITDYRTRDKGKLGYEIEVRVDPHGGWQDLTHVGVGVSQVLPIVVMFLLSEPGDLLVFEQPELHLHPLVQSRLTDLFCAMSELRRQCLIETHSEYMVNRLRLRIVQGRNGLLESQSAVFFITKSEGKSHFSEVEINKYGAIIEWPKDFFDQGDAEVERILIEGNRKLKAERDGK